MSRIFWGISLISITYMFGLSGCGFYTAQHTRTQTLKSEFSWLHENVIRPKCMGCHDGNHDSGFDARTYESIMEWAVVPGEPENSVLCDATKTMPPKGNLPKDEAKAICDWIAQGAKG